MPGQPPTRFAEKFDCKKASGGRGVMCIDTAKVPGLGALDFTHLVAYDPERKAVHWFAVGSTGEVHDHVCHWKDAKTLDCETIQVSVAHAYPGTEFYDFAQKNGFITNEKMEDGGGHQMAHEHVRIFDHAVVVRRDNHGDVAELGRWTPTHAQQPQR